MAGSLDGAHDVPLLPFNPTTAGADLGNAVLVPPGGNVFFVRGNGTSVTVYDYDPPGIRERLVASVQKALSYCVASRGDTIYVLEGHTENLASADSWSNLKIGVKIIGRGTGTDRPTFTFTTAGSTVLINKANVLITNCRFLCAGPAGTTALTVAAPFTVSAAGFNFIGNACEVGIDADQLCTAFFTSTAGATDMVISNNEIYGAANSDMTTCFSLVGASRLKFINNIVRGGLATDTKGLLEIITTAALNVMIANNVFHANSTGNKTCIDLSAAVATSGWLIRNYCRNMTDANTEWILLTGSSDVQLMDNFGINNSNERGLVIGTASV